MSTYQVLMRRLRPMSFSEVIGQKHIVETLKNSIKSGRIAHAYLFSGTRGVGKTTIARIFAKALSCEAPQDGEPCNKCNTCKAVNEGKLIDIQEIDGASNNSVNNIRELRENIIYPPITSKYKIYIIDEVHMLSSGAFNALLKTLEEPPKHAIFILATTELHKVPQTIISRCQHFDFKKISIADIKTSILNIAKRENFTINDDASLLIAREARGSIRDSLSILEQVISFSNAKINKQAVLDILGAVDRSTIISIAEYIIKSNTKDLLVSIQNLYENAYDLSRVARYLLEVFRDAIILKLNEDSANLINNSEDEQNRILNIAKLVSLEDLEHWFKMTSKLGEDMSRSSVPELIFEVGLINMARKTHFVLLEELLKKLGSTNTVESTEKKNSNLTTKPVIKPIKPSNNTERPDFYKQQKNQKTSTIINSSLVKKIKRELKDFIEEERIILQ